jgi:hypothetical protein
MNSNKPDFTKSIEQLENVFLSDYDFETSLVANVHAYRKVPIEDLSAEQIRLLIGQNIGLEFLIPKAMEFLTADILTDATFYEGDLLVAVISCNADYWNTHPTCKEQIYRLIKNRRPEIENRNDDNSLRQVLKKIEDFCKC